MRRIAHNATPLRWQGIDFSSFKALDIHLGKTFGYSRSYWVKGIDLLGYPIITEIAPPIYKSKTDRRISRKSSMQISRKWTDNKMIEFAAYCMCRKKEVGEIAFKGMLQNFKKLHNIK